MLYYIKMNESSTYEPTIHETNLVDLHTQQASENRARGEIMELPRSIRKTLAENAGREIESLFTWFKRKRLVA